VFVWTIASGDKRSGPVASEAEARAYALEELLPGAAFTVEQWEVGFPRIGPTRWSCTVPAREALP
jgi:hypothetical protein